MHGLLGNTFANFIGQLYQTAVAINSVYAGARGIINGFQRGPSKIRRTIAATGSYV